MTIHKKIFSYWYTNEQWKYVYLNFEDYLKFVGECTAGECDIAKLRGYFTYSFAQVYPTDKNESYLAKYENATKRAIGIWEQMQLGYQPAVREMVTDRREQNIKLYMSISSAYEWNKAINNQFFNSLDSTQTQFDLLDKQDL